MSDIYETAIEEITTVISKYMSDEFKGIISPHEMKNILDEALARRGLDGWY